MKTHLSRTLAVGLAALVVLSTMGGVASAAGTTDLTVSLADQELAPGETTTVAVAVTNADGGVGSADLGVSVTNPSVATITDVEVGGSPAATFTTVSIAGDGASADVNYFSADTSDTGAVTVLTVTLEAQSAGTTGVEVGPSPGQTAALVFDEGGSGYTLSSVGSATLTVADANAAPTADAGADQTVTEGETVTLDASGSTDADGDSLAYAWTQTGTGPSVSLSDASSATPTFTAPSVSEETTLAFDVTVDDGNGGTDADSVSVTVQPDEPDEPTNTPPVADAGGDQTVTEGASVALDASGSTDADGDQLGYSWTQTAGPSVTLSDASAATPTFTAPDVAAGTTLAFDVSVSDGNDSDTDSVSVTVQPETPPTGTPATSAHLEPPEDLLGVNQTGTYDIVVDATDGGVGAYSITVSLSDPSVGTITGVELAGDGSLSDVQMAEDGSSVTIEAVLVNTNDTGPVTLGTVSVEGAAEGESDLSLDVTTLGTEAGTAYEVTGTEGSALTVSTLVVGDSESPADDGDGDGLHEDVNGDGVVDVLDVQTLFHYRNSPTTVENPEAFDFNGDGTFDILDVQWLYYNEVESNDEGA